MKVSKLNFENVGCCEIHRQAHVAYGAVELFVNEIGEDLYSVTIYKKGVLENRVCGVTSAKVNKILEKYKQ